MNDEFAHDAEIIDQYVLANYGKMSYLEMTYGLRKDHGIDVGIKRIANRVASMQRFGVIKKRVVLPVKEARIRNEKIRLKVKMIDKRAEADSVRPVEAERLPA
jgi:hypothetical protein